MTRRNLRRWAQAKEERLRAAPPRGRWSRGPGGDLMPIFFEDPPYGTPVAPTVFLPIGEPEPVLSQEWMAVVLDQAPEVERTP